MNSAVANALAPDGKPTDNPAQECPPPSLEPATLPALTPTTSRLSWGATPGPAWDYKVAEVIKLVAGAWQLHHHRQLRFLLLPGKVLVHRCVTRLPAAMVAYKLDDFVHRHRGEMLHATPAAVAFRVPLPHAATPVQLEAHIQLTATAAKRSAALTVLAVEVRTRHCEPGDVDRLLREVSPVLLESLREELQARCERRADERLPWDAPLRLRPVAADGTLGEPVVCRARDVSVRGIGIILPHAPGAVHVALELPTQDGAAPVMVHAKVVRAEPRPDGTVEIGAMFLPRQEAAPVDGAR